MRFLPHNEDKARESLEGILAEEPKHLDALLRLGDTHLPKRNIRRQQVFITRHLLQSAEPRGAVTSLENLMEKTGRWAEALNYIEKILDIDTDNLSLIKEGYSRKG